jgi:hypothetical protein
LKPPPFTTRRLVIYPLNRVDTAHKIGKIMTLTILFGDTIPLFGKKGDLLRSFDLSIVSTHNEMIDIAFVLTGFYRIKLCKPLFEPAVTLQRSIAKSLTYPAGVDELGIDLRSFAPGGMGRHRRTQVHGQARGHEGPLRTLGAIAASDAISAAPMRGHISAAPMWGHTERPCPVRVVDLDQPSVQELL